MADGTRDDPWVLMTPPGSSEYTAFRDGGADPPALVVNVGRTELRYHLRSIDDLHEQKPAAEGTVEAWGRATDNPVGGWYGLRRGTAAASAGSSPPVLEQLGLAEVEHNPRNNRMRAV